MDLKKELHIAWVDFYLLAVGVSSLIRQSKDKHTRPFGNLVVGVSVNGCLLRPANEAFDWLTDSRESIQHSRGGKLVKQSKKMDV